MRSTAGDASRRMALLAFRRRRILSLILVVLAIIAAWMLRRRRKLTLTLSSAARTTEASHIVHLMRQPSSLQAPRRSQRESTKFAAFLSQCADRIVLLTTVHRWWSTSVSQACDLMFDARCAATRLRRPHVRCSVCSYKTEAATEARWLQQELEATLDRRCFLDSDDLSNLFKLRDHVRTSDCLLLLQTRNVLTRPWCIFEVWPPTDLII